MMLFVLIKRKFYLFLMMSFFCLPSMAAPTCDQTLVADMLTEMHLDTSIKYNQELLNALDKEYGNGMGKHLADKHSYLKGHRWGLVDKSTLAWARNAVFGADNFRTRYIPLISKSYDIRALDDYIRAVFESLFLFQRKSILVFKKEDDFLLFKTRAEDNLKNIISHFYPRMPEDEKSAKIQEFKDNYFDDDTYFFSFDQIPHNRAVIVIVGHGSAGVDGIKLGDTIIAAQDITNVLKEYKLPSDATIELNNCFSGCEIAPLPFTIAHIKDQFLKGNLMSLIKTDSSFLTVFSNFLHKDITTFNGVINGYVGTIQGRKQKSVLGLNGKYKKLSNAVAVWGTDGEIKIKKDEGTISIIR